jgi:hypothetical protein
MNSEDTQQKILEKVSGIEIKLTEIETRLLFFIQGHGDHEKRIRFLEKYAYIIAGGLIVIEIALRLVKL